MGDRKRVPVRFLHIPKCGGSTFSYILNREYRNGLRFAFSGNAEQDRERYEALRLNARDSCVLYRGHAPIETGIEAVDDALTITMFRDPVRRVKSFCQHVSEGKSPHLVGRFPPSSFNLDEFLESGLGELSNLQVKMMINCGSCEDSTRLNQLGGEVVDVAIKHLHERVAIFGLLEKYDESLIHLLIFWAGDCQFMPSGMFKTRSVCLCLSLGTYSKSKHSMSQIRHSTSTHLKSIKNAIHCRRFKRRSSRSSSF